MNDQRAQLSPFQGQFLIKNWVWLCSAQLVYLVFSWKILFYYWAGPGTLLWVPVPGRIAHMSKCNYIRQKIQRNQRGSRSKIHSMHCPRAYYAHSRPLRLWSFVLKAGLIWIDEEWYGRNWVFHQSYQTSYNNSWQTYALDHNWLA